MTTESTAAIVGKALAMLQDATRAASAAGMAGLAVVAIANRDQDEQAATAGHEVVTRATASARELYRAVDALETVLTANALSTGRLVRGRH